MKIITIKRVAYRQDGTYGVIFDEGDLPFALTLERKWLNNKKGESCIPEGEYSCKRVVSPKFGDTFEVQNVPNRSEILFHKGNIEDDSHGCILIGEQFDPIKDRYGVLASREGFEEFKERLAGHDEFKLIILKLTAVGI